MTLTELGEREGYRPDALARWLTSVDYVHAEVTRQRLVDRLEAGVAVLEAGGQVQAAADAADMGAANFCRSIRRHYGVAPKQIRHLWLTKRVSCLLRLGLDARTAARILGWSPPTVRRIAARDGWRFNGMEWVQEAA
jgi:methylphosphotriester-DNA--protein-cysteine methyltransferase